MAKLETATICTVKVDEEKIRYNVETVVIEQPIDGHHELDVTLSQAVRDKFEIYDPSDYTDFLGKTISILIEPTGGKIEASHILEFIGLVTEVSFDNSIDALNVISIRAKSPTITMDGAKTNAFFSEQKASDLINSIARSHPITLGRVDSTNTTYRHVLQYNESDYEFIMRMAGNNGLFAFYNGTEFQAVKAHSSGAVDLTWRESLGGFVVELGTAQPEYGSQMFYYEQARDFKSESKNVSQSKSLSDLTRKSPDASKEIYKKTSYFPVYNQVKDAQSMDETVRIVRDSALSRMVKCGGQSIRPDIKVGQCVQIRGMSRFDGPYWVTGVTHTFDKGGKYYNEFKCKPLDVANANYPGDRDCGANIQPAIVTDNADPDQMGRIKVKFSWSGDGETYWARYLTLHAGQDRGWYALPEIGDEVLVAFEMGDPDRPYVIGSLYNSDNTPHADTQVDDNNIKMFLTKGGNKIVVKDESGKESIEITNADGKNSILLDASSPAISITCEGDISISGANITIKGTGNVEIKADSDIKANSGANMELKASANQKVEASGTQDLKGAMVNVKGNPINLN